MKIPWKDYFIALAYLVSQRSIDPATKIGCVITDQENTILSVGYNSPPRGCLDSEMPLTRPEKYGIMCHSEIAAISNAARNGVPLRNSTFYITAHPCETCLQAIINVGASKIIHGNVSAHCVNEKSKIAIGRMMRGRTSLIIENYQDIDKVIGLLESTVEYTKYKNFPAQVDNKI